jgi:hypothetical protein
MENIPTIAIPTQSTQPSTWNTELHAYWQAWGTGIQTLATQVNVLDTGSAQSQNTLAVRTIKYFNDNPNSGSTIINASSSIFDTNIRKSSSVIAVYMVMLFKKITQNALNSPVFTPFKPDTSSVLDPIAGGTLRQQIIAGVSLVKSIPSLLGEIKDVVILVKNLEITVTIFKKPIALAEASKISALVTTAQQ